MTKRAPTEASANKLVTYLLEKGLGGVPPLSSAENLAIGKTVITENCEDCHGATGSDPDVGAPRLNGQWARYMALELEKYRDPEFRMTHRKMRKAARELKEGEVHPVAAYFGAQDK